MTAKKKTKKVKLDEADLENLNASVGWLDDKAEGLSTEDAVKRILAEYAYARKVSREAHEQVNSLSRQLEDVRNTVYNYHHYKHKMKILTQEISDELEKNIPF